MQHQDHQPGRRRAVAALVASGVAALAVPAEARGPRSKRSTDLGLRLMPRLRAVNPERGATIRQYEVACTCCGRTDGLRLRRPPVREGGLCALCMERTAYYE